MNVEIGAEAALFPEKEYINGIAVAVQLGDTGEGSFYDQRAELGTSGKRPGNRSIIIGLDFTIGI
jgi:hypothetical protein